MAGGGGTSPAASARISSGTSSAASRTVATQSPSCQILRTVRSDSGWALTRSARPATSRPANTSPIDGSGVTFWAMVESEHGDDALSRRRATQILAETWSALGGAPGLPDRVGIVQVDGCRGLLPSVYDVTALAVAAVAAATLAVAEFGAARRDAPLPPVEVDPVDAAAAFRGEALQQPVGWQLPPVWDPIAGVYQSADGYIRLHTNYAHHRAAVLDVLDLPDGAERPDVAARVAGRSGDDLEAAVVERGGAAAVARTAADWARHPHGHLARREPPVTLHREPDGERPRPRSGVPPVATDAPLSGVRVLDLTRVVAGPVATRTLAAWGADVLRIDPPGFAEVPALLPVLTSGKRCAAVDLSRDPAAFAGLVRECDVIVHGLRPGALERLGFGPAALRALNPGVVEVTHDAYGWAGPWAGRRGFDSLVQFSCGIGSATASGGPGAPPGSLPAQALDHATGHLLAAAACRGLTERLAGRTGSARASLVGVANLLMRHPVPGPPPPIDLARAESRRVIGETTWGRLLSVPQPGSIGGRRGELRRPAGPLGRHRPGFSEA